MLFALALLAATDPDAAHALDRIEVSAARVRGVQAFDLPASVSRVDLRAAHQGAGTTIASALGGIPGLAARDRQNHAQDTQLSVRGFGARSTFGVRGLRIYIDGIPATMPDGQGQVSHFALATARRVDVLRGPFSALHGNSSGGVIDNVRTPPWYLAKLVSTQYDFAQRNRDRSFAFECAVVGRRKSDI